MGRIVPILLGVGTALLAAGLNFEVNQWVSWDISMIFFFFVIPLGAIFIGMVGCSGFLVGSAMTADESLWTFIGTLLSAILAFILTHWFIYLGTVPEELRPDFPLWDFVKLRFSHMTIDIFVEVHHHDQEFKPGFELGAVSLIPSFSHGNNRHEHGCV